MRKRLDMKIYKGKMIETTVIKSNDKLNIGDTYWTSDIDDVFKCSFCRASTAQAERNMKRLNEYMRRL